MIEARKNAAVDALFGLYTRSRVRAAFHGVHLRGAAHFTPAHLPPGKPVLALVNHTNWWDLFLLHRLTRLVPHKAHYGMMEERNLAPHRFLRGLGLFSVDLETPGRAALGLRRAVRHLRQPDVLLWLFPQGRIEAPGLPGAVRPGAAWLAARVPDAVVLPIALRYEFFREERPAVLVEAAAPVPAASITGDDALLSLLRAPALSLERLVAAEPGRDLAALLRAGEFVPLERPRLSANKKWEWFRRALAGRLAGFDPHN
ncbi:1-acyl-sn-glycerol-3-phosphate acyltransferase [Verrucomicrobium sp. GAS474]|nr:1-acyl-sn-glycerol-3-phosphate acyltransferase [Verrucomicrobium sp. GAS474]